MEDVNSWNGCLPADTEPNGGYLLDIRRAWGSK